MVTSEGPLSETVDRIRSVSQEESVSVGDVVESAGDQGILPVILVPALVAVTPLSGIPGLSGACGVLIAILSFELIAGFSTLYLPKRLKALSVDGAKMRAALEKISPVTRWLDGHTSRRAAFLFHRPLIWIPQLICIISGLAMPVLELIPFSSSISAAGVCLLVMAMMARDGLIFCLALLPYAGLAYLALQTAS